MLNSSFLQHMLEFCQVRCFISVKVQETSDYIEYESGEDTLSKIHMLTDNLNEIREYLTKIKKHRIFMENEVYIITKGKMMTKY